MAADATARFDRRFAPAIPYSVNDLKIPLRLLHDIFLRRVAADGTSTLRSLSHALKIAPSVTEAIFRHFSSERLLDVKGSTEDDYAFSLTSAGQRLAAHRNRVTQYIGPAPVSLTEYAIAVRSQCQNVAVSRSAVRRVLSDLVITEDLVTNIGPALRSDRSMFLYGPTGNGKSAIAERLHRIYEDSIYIPYAVEVDGQIIVLHDPIVHRRVDGQPDDIDARWVLCHRPFLVIGGEMTPDMLELRLDDASRTYAAPIQMKANNGMLVIDDFGRQAIPPRKLLNRWIVPLDRRVDFLSLRYGVKFEIPFELKLVFATNLDPNDLADAAFLRRLQNKIYIGAVGDAVFDQIFARFTQERDIECESGIAEYVRYLCRDHGCPELRACLPADLCAIAQSVRSFDEASGPLTRSDFERAASLYFARTTEFVDSDINETSNPHE